MKKKLLIFLLVLFLSSSNVAFAHPGRTDSNGGHVCRTNCASWGLKTGQYHKHKKAVKKKIVKKETKKSSHKNVKTISGKKK
ncbi:MAG: YHYH domain-containing protein [Patescibacteria group bacterium]|jgi:hypothetical protein